MDSSDQEVRFPERGPHRTCVACRKEEAREDLLRLVAAPDGSVVVDLRARLPGRGAWVHPDRACVEIASGRRGLLSRALDASVDATSLLERVRAAVESSALDGLSMAAAAGALVGGHDLLEGALRSGEVVEVVVASDASERTIDSLRSSAREGMAFTRVSLGREKLGARVGRGDRAALGILPSRAASPLRRQLRRLRALS